jgi:hypothetical protein
MDNVTAAAPAAIHRRRAVLSSRRIPGWFSSKVAVLLSVSFMVALLWISDMTPESRPIM